MMTRTSLAEILSVASTIAKIMKRTLVLALALLSGTLALQAASLNTSPLSGAKAYPNPWRVDRHQNLPVRFDGMPGGSHIKIFTIAGHLVKELTADSAGFAPWDRTNSSGQHVASGVYIYLLIDPQGNDASGKIAIIR
jgi:hypothetical protein